MSRGLGDVYKRQAYMFKDGYEEKLRTYVENGGTLVLSYWSGLVDGTDRCFLGGTPYGLMDVASAKDDIRKWMQRVDLPENTVYKYPHEVSGGQLQRVVLARIMLMNPKLVLFDEPTSALDAVNQKLVLDLLQKLHSEQPFGYVFVSHDIGLLQAVTDRIIVMKDGQIVETIESKRLKEAVHPYTKSLVEASE